MKNTIRLAVPFVAAAMIACTPLMVQAQQDNTTMSSTTAGNPEQEQAFRDGMQAAQLDKAANRSIQAENSHLYKHPPVKKDKQDAYRDAFKKGYAAQVAKSAGL